MKSGIKTCIGHREGGESGPALKRKVFNKQQAIGSDFVVVPQSNHGYKTAYLFQISVGMCCSTKVVFEFYFNGFKVNFDNLLHFTIVLYCNNQKKPFSGTFNPIVRGLHTGVGCGATQLSTILGLAVDICLLLSTY
jgi:hypothetical protein